MKTVFSNNEIFHIYATQSQNNGRGNSTSFHTNLAYSYNLVIGNIQQKYIFIYRYNYSNTTVKHLNHLHQATSHYKQILVKNANYPNDIENLNDIASNIKNAEYKLSKAKKPAIYIKEIEQEKSYAIDLMNALIELEIKTSDDFQQLYQEITKKEIDSNYIAKLKELEEIKRIKEKQQELEEIQKFRNFETNAVWYSKNQYLRINKETENLETSKEVKVNLKKALFLFNVYKKVLNGELPESKLVGQKIDYYTINQANDKGVRIGCHYITKQELFNVLESK